MVVYNITNTPIVIVTKWKADPELGPAIREITHMIEPGQAIDLSVLGLELKGDK